MTKDKKIDFEIFLKKNQDKIHSITPVNPTIKKDDEWLEKNKWNEYYDKLKEK